MSTSRAQFNLSNPFDDGAGPKSFRKVQTTLEPVNAVAQDNNLYQSSSPHDTT
jgi:hypothetical protein